MAVRPFLRRSSSVHAAQQWPRLDHNGQKHIIVAGLVDCEGRIAWHLQAAYNVIGQAQPGSCRLACG